MTLTQLEYILAVDKYRHFGKAAKSCFVTQPTLSMQLQKLEDEIGIIVFDRSKNPILPTLEGEVIIKQAKVVIREHKRIYDLISEAKSNLNGTLKLAIIPTLAQYIVPLFAQKFVSNYSNVKLIIEEYKTEDIITLIENDEIDAGILVTPLHNDSIIERVLFYEPFYLYISPEHQLSKKKMVNQNDLSLDDIWLLNKGNCFRDQVLNICSERKKTQKKNIQNNLRFESGNFETLKNMVSNFSGYTILPHLALNDLSPNQKKNIRSFYTPVPTREVSLIHSRIFLKERIINALEKEIINTIPKELSSLKNREVEIVEIFGENNDKK